jgi:hypothetical protein
MDRESTEFSEYTWQTLYEYIERRIASARHAIQFLREDPRLPRDDPSMVESDQIHITSFETQLERLLSCLPLIREMQSRENLQAIRPIMSVEIIRLGCRRVLRDQDDYLEFAWILPKPGNRYRLQTMHTNSAPLPEDEWSPDLGLSQVVDEVEKLAREYCGRATK